MRLVCDANDLFTTFLFRFVHVQHYSTESHMQQAELNDANIIYLASTFLKKLLIGSSYTPACKRNEMVVNRGGGEGEGEGEGEEERETD